MKIKLSEETKNKIIIHYFLLRLWFLKEKDIISIEEDENWIYVRYKNGGFYEIDYFRKSDMERVVI